MTLLATLLVLAVVVLGLAFGYLAWVAGRHERLAARADAAWAALDAHLVRRAAPAQTLAALRGEPELADRAAAALASAPQEREAAENALGRALRAGGYGLDPDGLREGTRPAPGRPAAEQAALTELVTAADRVRLARQVHNDAVRDLLAIRRRPAARMMRLGHGDQPGPGRAYFEIDDSAVPPPQR